jgi:hypothetical protein
LAKGDGPERYRAQVKLRNETSKAARPGNDADRNALAAAMAAYVAESQPKERRRIYDRPFANTPVRLEFLRYLAEIAGDAEVDVLMKSVDDLEVRDGIRRVLEAAPGAKATAALVQCATGEEGTEFRLGAINALGKRTGEGVSAALAKCSTDADPRIRLAAAEAMSQHADPGLDSLIVSALDPAKGAAPHGDCAALRLRLAANVAKAGNKEAAQKIYQAVGATKPTACKEKAVKIGLGG